MVKSELINFLVENQENPHSLPPKDVEHAVSEILSLMVKSLESGGRIEIRGFGSFSLHFRPPRNARNPKTGQVVKTEAKYTPHFKPGKALRERVNESRNHCAIEKDSSGHED